MRRTNADLELILTRAVADAVSAHAGQEDKCGVAYWHHLYEVASRVNGTKLRIVAWLHDILEDTVVTLEELSATNIPDDCLDAIYAITRRTDEPYFTYIRRCARNEMARVVKLADLDHNCEPSRMLFAGEPERASLLKRYEKAKAILESNARPIQ